MEKNERKIDRYEEAKRKVLIKTNDPYTSDKEIIEHLSKELEQCQNSMYKKEGIIDSLSKLISNEQDYKEDNENILDDDIEEIITTTQMADGKIIKTITEYKYKED